MASSDPDAELARTRAVLASFASAANHDLNAPLRHIHMFAELIRRDHGAELPEGAAGYLDRILFSVARSERLVAALVDYARLASAPPHMEPIDLGAIAQAASEPFKAKIEAAGGSLSLKPIPDARGDAARVQRVVEALVDNAVKYRAHCLPIIEISGYQLSDREVAVRVSDQGPGLPAAHSDAAFELLRRLTGANDIDGEGVGLAMCKLLVEMHGGVIRHVREREDGTTFEFTLPAAD